MAKAFEDLQAQNTRLVAHLAEKDEASNALVAERLKVGGQTIKTRAGFAAGPRVRQLRLS